MAGHPRRAKDACEAALDAMRKAYGFPPGYVFQFDAGPNTAHAPLVQSYGYYADLTARRGSPWL